MKYEMDRLLKDVYQQEVKPESKSLCLLNFLTLPFEECRRRSKTI